ncbi:MAG: hypothetical protein ACK5IB_08260 [Qingshengfaniella sp.]
MHNLLPRQAFGLRSVLGEHYASWIACRNADPRGGEYQSLFRAWAQNNLPHDRALWAIKLFSNSSGDPLYHAMAAYASTRHSMPFVGPKGWHMRLPKYGVAHDCACHALRGSAAVRICFESHPEQSAAGGARQICGEATPQRYFWNRNARSGPELRFLDRKALAAPISVRGRFDGIARLPVRAGAWLDEFEIERAWRSGDDPEVWDEAAGASWSDFFGPEGGLARRIAEVVVAGGFELEVTCHAVFSEAEVAQIRAEATGGVWPMIAMEEPPTHRVRVHHEVDGSLTHRLVLDDSRVQILGGIVEDAPG